MRRGAGALAGLLALILIAVFAAFYLRRSKPAPPPPKATQAPRIPTAVFVGKIRAQHTIAVRATVNGEVGSFLADVGQDVYEGQLLARLVNPGLETGRETAARAVEVGQAKINSLESAIIATRLEVSRARADATRAKDQFERSEKLYRRQTILQNEGATPRLVYEKAQRDFESTQGEWNALDVIAGQAEERAASLSQELQSAKKTMEDKNRQLEEMQANLAAADVHSPVTGVVIARRGEVGRMLDPDEASELFQIAVDLSLLQAVFEPDAVTLSRIKPGQPAFVSIADLQTDALPAAIKEVKGGEAVAEITSPHAGIRPGMNCSVTVSESFAGRDRKNGIEGPERK